MKYLNDSIELFPFWREPFWSVDMHGTIIIFFRITIFHLFSFFLFFFFYSIIPTQSRSNVNSHTTKRSGGWIKMSILIKQLASIFSKLWMWSNNYVRTFTAYVFVLLFTKVRNFSYCQYPEFLKHWKCLLFVCTSPTADFFSNSLD